MLWRISVMPGELKNAANDFMAALDAMDLDRMMQAVTEDAQSVDEISRRWLRGRGEVNNYLRELMASVSDVRTELRDAEERVWGDTGILTFWIDQDYNMNGNPQHVSAPTTMVLRRDGDDWKVALFHSIPLPEQS
jgi:ketosteroid isomerase-like protein